MDAFLCCENCALHQKREIRRLSKSGTTFFIFATDAVSLSLLMARTRQCARQCSRHRFRRRNNTNEDASSGDSSHESPVPYEQHTLTAPGGHPLSIFSKTQDAERYICAMFVFTFSHPLLRPLPLLPNTQNGLKYRCKDVLKDPIDITCPEHHHVCRGCIVALGVTTNVGDFIYCPSCHGQIPNSQRNNRTQEAWAWKVDTVLFNDEKVNRFIRGIIEGLDTTCKHAAQDDGDKCDFSGKFVLSFSAKRKKNQPQTQAPYSISLNTSIYALSKVLHARVTEKDVEILFAKTFFRIWLFARIGQSSAGLGNASKRFVALRWRLIARGVLIVKCNALPATCLCLGYRLASTRKVIAKRELSNALTKNTDVKTK